MSKLFIHIFDQRLINSPITTYDPRSYKKLSSQNEIYPFKGDSGDDFFICFKDNEIIDIDPSSFYKTIVDEFASIGVRNEFGAVMLHTTPDIINGQLTILNWIYRFIASLNNSYGINSPVYLIYKVNGIIKSMEISRVLYSKFSSNIMQQTVDTAIKNDSVRDVYDSLGLEFTDEEDTSDEDGVFSFGGNDDDDDNDDWSISDKDTSDSDFIGEASAVMQADGAKRSFKNHNIVIAKRKDIKHDRRIIRAFLKDFIPGDSPSIVRIRAEMEDRWINCLAISKEEANSARGRERLKAIGKFAKDTITWVGSAATVATGINSLIGKGRI